MLQVEKVSLELVFLFVCAVPLGGQMGDGKEYVDLQVTHSIYILPGKCEICRDMCNHKGKYTILDKRIVQFLLA